MEFPAYKGGAGGKFQPRPFRQPTPYDRPPSAARRLLSRFGTPARSGRRLFDSALQFIAGRASSIISSVFRKRLRTLPEAIDQPGDVPRSESHVQEAIDGHNRTSRVSEIEQLVMQNEYTKAEVDYIVGLMYSRAIKPTAGQEPDHSDEKPVLHGTDNGSTGLRNFMSSSLPKASCSRAIGLQSRSVLGEDKSWLFSGPFATKSHGRPVLRRSGQLPGAGYPVPKPHGRSAIYRMCRSPYFNADPASSSHGRQGLKRSWPVLDREHGSNGPIRRIRQKSALIFAADARLVAPRNYHGFPLLQSDREGLKDPASSQQPQSVIELYAGSALQIHENGDVPMVPRKSIETSRRILEHLDKPENKAMNESLSKPTNDMPKGQELRNMRKRRMEFDDGER